MIFPESRHQNFVYGEMGTVVDLATLPQEYTCILAMLRRSAGEQQTTQTPTVPAQSKADRYFSIHTF